MINMRKYHFCLNRGGIISFSTDSALQNSLQLLQEIRSSLQKEKPTPRQQKEKYINKHPEINIQTQTSSSQSSVQITEEILETMRINTKQFEKQCIEVEKKLRDIMENIESENESR
ncbi:hypothetical protein pb186bvf_014921 [Paramecium bursaria]